MNLFEKILSAHCSAPLPAAGQPVSLRIDQTLTQDALGMLAYLSFEQMGCDCVQTELSVSYLDHNLLYTDFRNPDDHAYLTSVAQRYGITVSRAGNGICHAVHLARFAKPGKTLIGTDSHTPSAGALGSLGFGAGGLEVGAVMAGEMLAIAMPRVVRVELTGALPKGVNAKDAALELIRRVGVKGGLGCVFEFSGEALSRLPVPERLTLANLSVETGATSALFPSDEQTERYLKAQGRAEDFLPLQADGDAAYDSVIEINLSALRPLAAIPHQPDRVVPVEQVEKIKVDQVFIGSCTNSSYSDLMKAAKILEGRRIAPHVSLVVGPGTRQNYLHLLRDGAIDSFLRAGARILECGCGPCVGMGQAVKTGGVSVRTINRNFKGRCGTADSYTYIASPETAAATAIAGYLTDAASVCSLDVLAEIREPERYENDDVLLEHNQGANPQVSVLRGPNIRPIPIGDGFLNRLDAAVVIKLGDNISTDEIAPSGAKNVANRANIEAVSQSTFERIDPDFWKRATALGNSVIVAGDNYGQGSSREHAALMPMYLGVKAVLAKSFARIHRANLINFGLYPLEFDNSDDYDAIHPGDRLVLEDLTDALDRGASSLHNVTQGTHYPVKLQVSPREKEILQAGGVLRYIKKRKEASP